MSGGKINRSLAVSLTCLAVLYACTQLGSVFAGRKQHDFNTYYHAALAQNRGLDPYSLQSLRQVSGNSDLRLPFVYPPHSLTLFKPFSRLGYRQAYFLFLGLKLLALVGLVLIWVRIFPRRRGEWWVLLVTVVMGYRCAVLRDLRAGNVSIFEQLPFWGGILLLLRGRSAAGGLGILISSFFKLVSAGLIPLVVVVRRTWRTALTMALLGLGYLLAILGSYTAMTEPWRRFIAAAGELDERGNICPSSLALFRDLADGAGLGSATSLTAYIILCCVVLSILIWAFGATRHLRRQQPMIYLTILAYVLLSPRMKDYSLIIVLLPTLHILSTVCLKRWQAVAGCVLLWIPLFDYQSLALAALVFGLLVAWILSNRGSSRAEMATSLNPLRCFGELGSPKVVAMDNVPGDDSSTPDS